MNSRLWRKMLTVAGVLVALGAVAPAANATVLFGVKGDIECTTDSGWCTTKANNVQGFTGWAQLDGTGDDALASGYRWTGYSWQDASIRTKSRWFSLSQNTADWAILQAYDTGVWVAVKPAKVNLWLQESYVKKRFAPGDCVVPTSTTNSVSVVSKSCYASRSRFY